MTYEMPSVLDVLRLLQNSIENDRYGYGGDHPVTLDELLEIVRDTADRIEAEKHETEGEVVCLDCLHLEDGFCRAKNYPVTIKLFHNCSYHKAAGRGEGRNDKRTRRIVVARDRNTQDRVGGGEE